MAAASLSVYVKGELKWKHGGNRSEIRSLYRYSKKLKLEELKKLYGENINKKDDVEFYCKFNK